MNASRNSGYYCFRFLPQGELFLSGKKQNPHGRYRHGNTWLVLGTPLGLIQKITFSWGAWVAYFSGGLLVLA